MKRAFAILSVILLVATSASAMTAKEIVEKMRTQETYQDAVTKIKMDIVNPDGKTRTRVLITRYKKKGELSYASTTFIYPDEVKGTKFLVAETKPGESDQYLFAPQIGRVRKIMAKERSGSFMGTDFSYSDLRPHDPEKGNHTLLREEEFGGYDCYVVESVPKKGETDYDYSKVTYWVRKDNYVPIKVLFYDKSGVLLKQLTTSEVVQTADGIWYSKKSVMENLKTGSRTISEIQEMKTNAGLSDDFFTTRFLEDQTRL